MSNAPSTQAPPTTLSGILRQLGPGLIIAGSIVGSGELIATTKTGAQAGFWLLWLILIGCTIKVFVQVEFGRYAISSGKATMSAMDETPGPRLGVSWLLWFWLAMFVVSLGQLGGIVHGVGQALALNFPITGTYQQLLDEQDEWDARAAPILAELEAADESEVVRRLGRPRPDDASEGLSWTEADQRLLDEWDAQAAPILAGLEAANEAEVIRQLHGSKPDYHTEGFFWTDDILWAAIVTALTIVLLVVGRYGLVQNFSIVMVVLFTAVTMFCVFAMQWHAEWAVTWTELGQGLSFRLPPVIDEMSRWKPLTTALATFGIIGVGANELIAYPYWCVEKGYAQFTGPRDDSPQWAERARGWLRVMRWDAGVSMIIYTFATVAFYLLGAAVLHRTGQDPAGSRMIVTLGEMYVPVFGQWAKLLFLFGAVAVLYSTFFVANAGHARVSADAVRIFGFRKDSEQSRLWWIRVFCVFFPVFSLTACVFIRQPAQLVLASGVMQALMLPLLAGTTLHYRYRRCDKRITPGRLWDVMLWLSALGMLIAGGGIIVTKLLSLCSG